MFSCQTPYTPPTTEEDELSFLRLVRSRRVGPTTFHRLMAEHGSAPAALDALPEVARASGMERYESCPAAVALKELATGRRLGARPLLYGRKDYPPGLLGLADAPPFLWSIGDPALAARPSVALIGARNASSLGLRMARRLAGELSEAGFLIVSGLARGIDAAAHEAALPLGTAGVQAGGIDVVYPAENAALYRNMAEKGLRLAELPPGAEPVARHFPQRNRIIAGMAQATLVIEAAARSGSLLTARMALDYGREVMAVPGHPLDGRATGCNMLIRDGAVLIRDAADVIALIGAPEPAAAPAPAAPPPSPPPEPAAQDIAARILAALGPSPTPEDLVLRDLAIDAATFTRHVFLLELDGRVRRLPGALLSRT